MQEQIAKAKVLLVFDIQLTEPCPQLQQEQANKVLNEILAKAPVCEQVLYIIRLCAS